MGSTYRVLSGLIALCVVAQASFIAGGWFGAIRDVDDGTTVIDKDYGATSDMACTPTSATTSSPLLAIALLIVSFFAKVPGGVKWALIVFGVVVLQFMLAMIAFGVPVVGALHGINALVLFTVAGYTSRRPGIRGAATASGEEAGATAKA